MSRTTTSGACGHSETSTRSKPDDPSRLIGVYPEAVCEKRGGWRQIEVSKEPVGYGLVVVVPCVRALRELMSPHHSWPALYSRLAFTTDAAFTKLGRSTDHDENFHAGNHPIIRSFRRARFWLFERGRCLIHQAMHPTSGKLWGAPILRDLN
jgi:hypothetical protein